MLSFRFAMKNLLRNRKYTFGLLFVYFAVSVLCLSFFLFTTMVNDSYAGILARRASTSYVSVAFDYLVDDNNLLDLTDEQATALAQITGVVETEKFIFNTGANYFQIDDGRQIEADISVIATRSRTVPAAYLREFDTVGGGVWLVCGDQPQSDCQCVVSQAFLSLIGEEKAEDILGKTIKMSDFFNNPVSGEMQIVGVVDVGFFSVSALAGGSKYFLVCGMQALRGDARCFYEYRLFSDYSNLEKIKDDVQEIGIKNATVTLGNNDYSIKKLSQTARFISAMLALTAVLCLLSCSVYSVGAALLKFYRNRGFYYAAFAVGASKRRLALGFLIEFLVVAGIAFCFAVPACIGIMQGVSRLTGLFTNFALSAKPYFRDVISALSPVVLSAVVSTLVVRKKIRFEKKCS